MRTEECTSVNSISETAEKSYSRVIEETCDEESMRRRRAGVKREIIKG
jgi:hypothetical protein